MTKNEWDKCFVWLVESFANWTPNAATSSVWYEELGGMTVDEFKTAVRKSRMKTVSAFPPSVSQIFAELVNDEDTPEVLANEAWQCILSNCGGEHDHDDPRTERALRAVGGGDFVRHVQFEDLKWLEKKFIEIWIGCNESYQFKKLKKVAQIESPELKQIASVIGERMKMK